MEELEITDGRDYLKQVLAQNPHPPITPYGVLYQNRDAPEQIYDGMNFPYYHYEDTPITLPLSNQNRFEYLLFAH